uniref:Uncharacterized protein n=1 Tax=Arion vulgaris TaxID=1028688 RepID=A0A0B7A1V0_9EUPU
MATQFVNYRLEVDDNKVKAECYFPGIAYDDYGRAGNINPWKVLRMFEAGRAIPFRIGNLLDYIDLISAGNYGSFALGGDYYFDPSLWEVGHGYQYFPYKITIELVSIGQTSFTVRQVLFNTIDHKELASFIGKLVFVDTKTKRPQAFPSWHNIKYSTLQSQDTFKVDVPVTSVPDYAFSRTFVVTASDTDHNGHTNQASYVRFCLDATEAARRHQFLHHFTSDICFYPIVKMSVAYRGETLCGDELTVSLWDIGHNSSNLHFAISRGTTIVFVAAVKFRESAVSKL